MPEIAEEDIRAFLLPLMIPKGGSEPELAVPGILKEPYDAMKRLLSNPYQPGAGEENRQAIIDALTVGGSAGLGSIAAPRPANSLGIFGGSRMRKNLEAAGLNLEDTPDILTKFKDLETGEISPFVDYTGTELIEFPFTKEHIRPDIWNLFEHPYTFRGHKFETPFSLGEIIDHPNLFKAMPGVEETP